MRKLIFSLSVLVALCAFAETKTFPRKVFLELFTSIRCSGCHTGHVTLNKFLEGRNDYVLIAHHAGFAEDELTTAYSNKIASDFKCGGNPRLMMDRTLHPDFDNERIFNFNYTESAALYQLGLRFDREDMTSNVGISVQPVYHTPDNLLAVTVTLEKNENLDPAALLSVVLAENSVTAKESQSGGGGYNQDHVVRHSFTDTMGDEIKWDGDTYTKTFTLEVPDGWNVDNLYAVAFVGLPFSTDLQGCPVFNAESNGDVEKSDESYVATEDPGTEPDPDPDPNPGTEPDPDPNPGTEPDPDPNPGTEPDVSVEAVGVQSERVTVVTLEGVVLMRDAEVTSLETLPRGFYLVNGKKHIIL